MTARSPCPICRTLAAPRSENPSAPFCSPRCRTLDLGNWLLESYRIPTEAASDEDEDGGVEAALAAQARGGGGA